MKLAIMQPYLFPYLGYFQLIHAADLFVIYDNIEYTKKGWINRNRILINNKPNYFTIPLKKSSDFLHVSDKELANNADEKIRGILRTVNNSYKKAPFFEDVYAMLEKALLSNEKKLFNFVYETLAIVLEYLNIKTKIVKSSSININHSLKGQDKVLAICNYFKAKEYINPIGGLEIYDKNMFKSHNIDLKFCKSDTFEYIQFDDEFVNGLSIIDIMMFNSVDEIKLFLNRFQFV